MREQADSPSSPKSWYFFLSLVFTLTSTLIIIIAFSSPYWLESYEASCSDFVKLGLWNVCFRNYRHPSYHIDQIFDGCNWIHSYKYHGIIGWLQPGWFILTQSLMASGLVFSAIASLFLCLVFVHYFKSFKVFLLAVSFVSAALSSLVVFLAICVFGSMCFDRAWIQYPNYNHLSWSYGMAIIGFILEGCASGLLLAEAFRLSRHVYRGTASYSVPSSSDQI